MSNSSSVTYHFHAAKDEEVAKSLTKESLKEALQKMLLIRQFELRAEAAYQQGNIGGFFHAYIGQEAIQTAVTLACGIEPNWYTTTYRCHALALLLGVSPKEIMAELFGKATGNAKGRGGSMHLYADRLTGGFGIVGGHVPISIGCGFALKYKKIDGVSFCFLGEGAVAQGAVHESLNLASLWNLPCIFVIENNKWGMGTGVERAIAKQPIAESLAPGYGLESMTLDGMNFFNCYSGFKEAYEKVKKTKRPILIEAITERFKGHSISDPALYRSKEILQQAMEKDPIKFLSSKLIQMGILKEEELEALTQEQKKIVIEAVEFAQKSPDPSIDSLEEDVFAP